MKFFKLCNFSSAVISSLTAWIILKIIPRWRGSRMKYPVLYDTSRRPQNRSGTTVWYWVSTIQNTLLPGTTMWEYTSPAVRLQLVHYLGCRMCITHAPLDYLGRSVLSAISPFSQSGICTTRLIYRGLAPH